MVFEFYLKKIMSTKRTRVHHIQPICYTRFICNPYIPPYRVWCQQKVAWDLSVEPYKCDNSRLLADCNRLHLELIRHSEEARLKALESRRTVRKLEIDNQCLEEQCSELADQIREMFASGSQSRKEARKPFVSTVRPKSATAANEPNTKRLASLTVAGSRCLKCSCSCAKEGKGNPAQRLRNDVQSQGDFISELRSQVSAKVGRRNNQSKPNRIFSFNLRNSNLLNSYSKIKHHTPIGFYAS